MPICSYLVVPEPGASDRIRARLAAIPECDVIGARNRDLLLLVTETGTSAQEARLRTRIEALTGVRDLVLTFGEIDPDTAEADPLASRSGGPRSFA